MTKESLQNPLQTMVSMFYARAYEKVKKCGVTPGEPIVCVSKLFGTAK